MADSFIDYARKAAQRAGIDPDLFIRQIQQESGFNPNVVSPAGARGIAQIMPQYHPGVDASDPYASLDYAAQLDAANLKKFGNTRDMLVAYNAGPGNAGKPDEKLPAETRSYLDKILGGSAVTSGSPPSAAPPVPGPAPQLSGQSPSPLTTMLLRGGVHPLAAALGGFAGFSNPPTQQELITLARMGLPPSDPWELVPDPNGSGKMVPGRTAQGQQPNPLAVSLLGGSAGTRAASGAPAAPAQPAAQQPAAQPSAGGDLTPNQFGDSTLSKEEAAAACGPAAAVAFARAKGRNPTLREALDLAKQTGWTPQGGMNGIANQKKLLDKMGIPATLVNSADWESIQSAAQSGSPVSISTPNHYFVADGYDPKTGKYHVGNSGLAFKAGSDWLSQQDITRLGGGVNGALFLG